MVIKDASISIPVNAGSPSMRFVQISINEGTFHENNHHRFSRRFHHEQRAGPG
jgi:hypothetical protein